MVHGYEIGIQDGGGRHFVFLTKFNNSAIGPIFRYRHEILQEYPEPLSKDDQMIKIDTGSKFKMAVAAILKSVNGP